MERNCGTLSWNSLGQILLQTNLSRAGNGVPGTNPVANVNICREAAESQILPTGASVSRLDMQDEEVGWQHPTPQSCKLLTLVIEKLTNQNRPTAIVRAAMMRVASSSASIRVTEPCRNVDRRAIPQYRATSRKQALARYDSSRWARTCDGIGDRLDACTRFLDVAQNRSRRRNPTATSYLANCSASVITRLRSAAFTRSNRRPL